MVSIFIILIVSTIVLIYLDYESSKQIGELKKNIDVLNKNFDVLLNVIEQSLVATQEMHAEYVKINNENTLENAKLKAEMFLKMNYNLMVTETIADYFDLFDDTEIEDVNDNNNDAEIKSDN